MSNIAMIGRKVKHLSYHLMLDTPSTTIQFALPKSAFVTLRVYDLLGRQVGELVNEKLTPGTYRTQWDASGLSSGVYFYRIQAGEFIETKKMVLLR